MEETKTKICKCCGQELSLDHFSKNHTQPDGYAYYCRSCVSQKAKERRLKNKALDNVACSEIGVKVFSNPALASFSPRQLMEELKARGFQWEYMLEPQRKVFYSKI